MSDHDDRETMADLDGPEEAYRLLDIEYADRDTRRLVQAIPEAAREPVSDDLLRDDRTRADSWLQFNKGVEQVGHSPADRITTENVADLEHEYTIDDLERGLRTTPVIVPTEPPVMYFNESDYTVHAVNARTGEAFWQFTPEVEATGGIRNWVRGAAVRGDKVYSITPVPEILALDRYTGELAWRRSLLHDDVDGEALDPRANGLTQMPTVYDGTLYVGMSGDANWFTTIQALDAETGDVRWRHNMAPPDEWVGDTWKWGGSNASWISPSVDPETGTVVFVTANPTPVLNSTVRPGPNKHSVSFIGVDAESGEIRWTSQMLPHDLWDYDLLDTPRIYEMRVGDETRRVASSNAAFGWNYIVDVETGQLIERSRPLCAQGGPGFLSLPPVGEANADPDERLSPGLRGPEWPGDAVSPVTGLEYYGAVNSGAHVWTDPDWEWSEGNYGFFAGGLVRAPYDRSAHVGAFDPATGEREWTFDLPDIDPDWIGLRAYTGGTTSTDGNVVFHASAGGTLFALDAETGDRLWADQPAERLYATPVTWDDPAGGKQYVAVAATNTGAIHVYALAS